MTILTSLFCLVLISACRYQPTTCPLQKNADPVDNAENELYGNAGCWLVKNGKILLIEQRNGLFSFPGGTAKAGESAQCTAHRETLEEAGVDAIVGRLKHQFDNGFLLFYCEAENVSLETNDSLEIAEVLLVDPAILPASMWRFPKQRQLAIEWLNE